MKTKWLMSKSAVLMGIIGLIAIFIPQELLSFFDFQAENTFLLIIIQITGALYLGFATLNWFTRNSRVGGIYSRPIVLGNLFHFTVVSLALLKEVFTTTNVEIIIATIIYAAFALWFGLVMYSNPIKNEKK